MRINFSTLLPFLLFHVFKGSSAQTVHDVVTYTTKSREKLECSFSSSIKQWTDQRDDGKAINLFLYDVSKGLPQKQTNDSKYNNFNYSIEGTNGFNLVINNVDRGDGGRYLCNPIVTSDSVTFDVTVEVLPKSVSIHCTEINVCMPSAEKKADPKINCVCTATGLSSSVLEIEWEGVGIFTASPTSIMNSTSGSFIIRSNITLPPPNGTATVSCSLSGYRSEIPKRLRSYTYTFSPPVCNLVHYCPSDGTNASLICSCSKGSPKVNAYTFYDSQKSPIGTQRSNSKSVQVETNKVEMFYCSGCNGVLHNRIEGHEFNCKQGQGSALWIIIVIVIVIVIVILLLLVFAAITFLVVKKPWSAEKKGAGPKQRKEGDGDEEHPLYDNTADQDQKLRDRRYEDPKDEEHPLCDNTAAQDQKLHDPRSEDPKGITPDVSTSGDPATKGEDKGKTVPSNEAQTKPTGSEEVPNTTTSNEGEDEGKQPVSSGGDQEPDMDEKGKTGLNEEAETKDSQCIDNDIPVYADVNKQRQVKGEADVSQQDDDHGDSGDNVNRGEGNPASTVRPPPEGQETTVNGQSGRDVGSEVDHGKRQSEKVVGSHVDSGKWEVDTTETSGGNQPTSHPAPSAKQKQQAKCQVLV